MNFLRKNIFLLLLIFFCVGVFLVTLKINYFRYTNFDFGKFDLGNMSQMLWNTLHGKPLFLTDYFGANVPRWAMSHVDPILLLFLPVFALFQNSMTLVISQLILVIFSSVLIYKIAYLKIKTQLGALMFGLAYLFYPATGFVIAWTGFHGVSVAIPFFLGMFYTFEKMSETKNFSKKYTNAFWLLLIITMLGKEQLALYIFFFGFYILFFRNTEYIFNFRKFFKTSISLFSYKIMAVSLLWFITAFFIIIPSNAHYRVEGFKKFTESLNIAGSNTTNVALPNYFLSRYEGFGNSYFRVFFGIAAHPKTAINVIFGGDRLDNFNRTFYPFLYTSFISPGILLMAFPDLLINYLTTEGGIGTSEIYNHRISMIIPIIVLSSIFAVSYLSSFSLLNKKIKSSYLSIFLASLLLGLNIYTTFTYNNPVYLWLTQALQKRLHASLVLAKSNIIIANLEDEPIGSVYRLSRLENRDRECAQKVIHMIPQDASVSGPDYLGAHLGLRKTYAIFPALYNSADYVIVDVFSKKITNILNIDNSLLKDVIDSLIKSHKYQLKAGCGNLFVFKNVGFYEKSNLLPIQEYFVYREKYSYEIFQTLTVVDYNLPKILHKGLRDNIDFTYIKRGNNSIDDYLLFMTFVNTQTGELYQVANLPSFGLIPLKDWTEDRYYKEDLVISVPSYLDSGEYKAYIGMTNNIRTRSIFLGKINIQ